MSLQARVRAGLGWAWPGTGLGRAQAGPGRARAGPGPAQSRPDGQKMVKKDKKWSDQDVRKAIRGLPGPKSIAEGPGTSWKYSGALKPQEKIKNQGILGLGGLGGSGPLLVPLKGAAYWSTGGRRHGRRPLSIKIKRVRP